MLRWFTCPDNNRIEIKDCLKEGGCRMGDRCATRSYLQMASSDRKWTGKPSTTQLIQGTMEAFLKITRDYATSPDSRAFMINGTKGHGVLEQYDDECSFLEERFDGDNTDITGIADVIEIENGKAILADHKTSGSFKVAKSLGFHTDKEETGEVFKSGPRKGQPKYRNVLKRDDSKIDRRDWALQLNKYRLEAEKRGIKIDEVKIQVICRDGGTFIARSRGVFRNVYYFKIERIPDNEVIAYFERKRKALHQALKQGYWKDICTAEENWDSLKCQRYCDVAEFCKYGKFLKQEKENEDMAIKGLSEIRRLPRLGKIRLGIKKKTKSGKEYPAEVDYFILDPQTPSELENEKLIGEFHTLYGEQPKSIKIMFPVAESDFYFPQFYKRYGSGASLKCKGDGELASCTMDEFAKGLKIKGKDEMGLTRVVCDGRDCIYYKKKECSEVGVLQALLPDLPGAGVWQITTGSFHSIVNLNSCIDYIKAVCGRAHMIPLTLERRPQETTFEGRKATHYILHINMDCRLSDIQKFAMIEPTKALLELPEPEAEKEDILFQENATIEPAEDVETGNADKIKALKMIERIARFTHLKEADNWNMKHGEEILTMPQALQKEVFAALNDKIQRLQDSAGIPPVEEPPLPEDTGEAIKPQQIKAIKTLLKKVGPQAEDEYIDWIRVNCKMDIDSLDCMTMAQAGEVIETIQNRKER